MECVLAHAAAQVWVPTDSSASLQNMGRSTTDGRMAK